MDKITKNRTAILIHGILSAALFALIFAKEPASYGDASKAWAHGVTYVLPLALGSMLFGWIGIIRLVILVKNLGLKKAFNDAKTIISVILLLLPIYLTVQLIRIIVLSMK